MTTLSKAARSLRLRALVVSVLLASSSVLLAVSSLCRRRAFSCNSPSTSTIFLAGSPPTILRYPWRASAGAYRRVLHDPYLGELEQPLDAGERPLHEIANVDSLAVLVEDTPASVT